MKIKNWFIRHKPSKRKLIQLYAALLTNANVKGFVNGQIYQGNSKTVCVPGLNCYSCPGAVGACPLGSLQNALASSGKSVPYYVFGIIMLYGLIAGRWICGFLCPFGLIQELLHKIKTPKIKKSRITRVLSYLKYVILVLFVVIYPLLYVIHLIPLPAFCKYICPAGTLEGAIGLLSNIQNSDLFSMLGPLFTWKFALLVIFCALCVFMYRFFCRFLCPLGAIYGFFNKISLVGVKLDAPKCIDCGICINKCKMDVRKVGDHECISCGECIDSCPTGAIHWNGSKFMINTDLAPSSDDGAEIAAWQKKNERIKKRNNILKLCVAILMSLTLIGVIVYFNFSELIFPEGNTESEQTTSIDETESQTESETDGESNSESGGEQSESETESGTESESAPSYSLGNNVGDLCYSMDVSLIDSDSPSFNVEDHRGKVTVINFWGTWCTPCVAELPHFDRIAAEYGNLVAIVALHSDYGKEQADSFIAQKHPDHTMLFGIDTGDTYYKKLGGKSTYPMTLVLDENGVIVFKRVGSLTYEQLKEIIDSALNNK